MSNKMLIKYIIAILSGIILFYLVSTMFFTIDTDEQGLVMRYGKFNKIALPGLNYKFPIPIESVEKISVTRVKKDIIGKIESVNHINNQYSKLLEYNFSYARESQMLTQDENIIDMHFYVQWKISNPKNFVFNIKYDNNNDIVRNSAESIMRQVIGGVSISEALSVRRLVIEKNLKEGLQDVMDFYHSGISIVSTGILYNYVAPEVRDAYRDVQSAKADKEKYINQAKAYKNQIIPRAKGQARSIIERALAYQTSIIYKALGESNKFDEIYKSYVVSKKITKKKIYLETIEEIYNNSNKILLDDKILYEN